jgi:hypothetical protein
LSKHQETADTPGVDMGKTIALVEEMRRRGQEVHNLCEAFAEQLVSFPVQEMEAFVRTVTQRILVVRDELRGARAKYAHLVERHKMMDRPTMADKTPEKLAREQAELERRTAERKAIRDANVASGLVPPGPGEDVS